MVRLQKDNMCIRTSIDLFNYVYLRTCRHVRVADLAIVITVTDDTIIKCGELYNKNQKPKNTKRMDNNCQSPTRIHSYVELVDPTWF